MYHFSIPPVSDGFGSGYAGKFMSAKNEKEGTPGKFKNMVQTIRYHMGKMLLYDEIEPVDAVAYPLPPLIAAAAQPAEPPAELPVAPPAAPNAEKRKAGDVRVAKVIADKKAKMSGGGGGGSST